MKKLFPFLLLLNAQEEKNMTEELWSKNENKESKWVFPDSENIFPLHATYKGIAKEISKNGATEFFIMLLESAGVTYKVTLGFNPKQVEKRINLNKMLEKFNKQTDAIGCQVVLTHNGERYELKPIEENIK